MENLRIGSRLLIGFGVMVLLTIVLGIYALQRHNALQSLTEQMNARDFTSLDLLRGIYRSADQMRTAREQILTAVLLRKEKMPADAPESFERQWRQYLDQAAKLLAELEANTATWENQALT